MIHSDLNLFIRDVSTVNYRAHSSADLQQVKVTKSKNPLLIQDLNSIKQSVITILSTPKGSRVFLPEFACDLLHYLYRPIDFSTTNAIEQELFTAITVWEKRINLTNLQVEPDILNSQYYVLFEYDIPSLMAADNISLNLKKLYA